MKKYACILLALVLAVSLTACAGNGAASVSGGQTPGRTGTPGLQYEPQVGGYVVTGYSGISANVVIPDDLGDGPVVKVAGHTFENQAVESVAMGSNIREIESYAFRTCRQLKSVTLNEGLLIVNGFAELTALHEIAVPSTVTTIDVCAFHRAYGLETVTFAKNSHLEIVRNGAFKECRSLRSINLSDTGVKAIDCTAFLNCTGIAEMRLPASCTAFGYEAFSGWTPDQTIYIGCARDDISLCYSGRIFGRENYTAEQWDLILEKIFYGCEAKIIFEA